MPADAATGRRGERPERGAWTLGRWVLAALVVPAVATAQVAIDPAQMEPTAWTRIALRVVNQGPVPWTRVRVEVPEAITVLGVRAPAGWEAARHAATDSTPQAIVWQGGRVAPGGFEEFAFLGRLGADARRRVLRFPVDLADEAGGMVRLRRGGDGAEPQMLITGTTSVSPWAAFALAGGAARSDSRRSPWSWRCGVARPVSSRPTPRPATSASSP